MTITVNKAMPEFIQRNDQAPRAWTVEQGQPLRGDAWTDMRAAKMRVPYGADETSRVVRAHELMHAKVSPLNREAMEAVGVRWDCIVAAEEFRVNSLIGQQGFNIDALADGSESSTGKLLGETGDWNSVVRFMASTAGTKAGSDFLRGLKSTNPVFAENARGIQKILKRELKRFLKPGTSYMASTTEKDGLPIGFTRFTVPIAKILEKLLIPEGGVGEPDEFATEEIPDVAKIAKGEFGQFAKLIEDKLPKPNSVDGRLGRKRVATNIGRNPRRMHRMLTDPDKRVFDRRARGRGGIVLIDQSGSMRLDEKDLWAIIEHAPGCVIIGYSHATGSTTVPNVWVLAERGRVVSEVRSGNGGNGVDGPAIRFALAKRRANEPFVWVCDGHVTDGAGDDFYMNLGEECAQLVVKNGIHMVASPYDAVESLKRVARGERLKAQVCGDIARTKAWRERVKES
jgi:hypothetical protein